MSTPSDDDNNAAVLPMMTMMSNGQFNQHYQYQSSLMSFIYTCYYAKHDFRSRCGIKKYDQTCSSSL